MTTVEFGVIIGLMKKEKPFQAAERAFALRVTLGSFDDFIKHTVAGKNPVMTERLRDFVDRRGGRKMVDCAVAQAKVGNYNGAHSLLIKARKQVGLRHSDFPHAVGATVAVYRTEHGWFGGALRATVVSRNGDSYVVRDEDGNLHDVPRTGDMATIA